MSKASTLQDKLAKRYGLAPLPEDASDEMREARIAELAKLRRRRQRRLMLGGVLSVAAVLAVILGLVWWLLSTLGGRDLLLAQIKARLPANASLEWQSAEGPVRGPLVLHGARFTWVACADDDFDVNTVAMSLCKDPRTTRFTASRLLLHPRLGALFSARLELAAIEVEGASLDIAKSDTPFELPTWPEVLPRIEPPLAIAVDEVRVENLDVSSAGEHVIRIRQLQGALLAEKGRLNVQNIDMESDLGRFHVHGQYAPGRNYATELLATAVFPARFGQTAGRVGLVARGDLDAMNIAIGGRAPAPLSAMLVLRAADSRAARDGDATWSLQAESEGFDPGVFSASAAAVELMTFRLNAEGKGGRADLQGQWQMGDTALDIQPSTLRLADQTLYAEPLKIAALGGSLEINGHGMFKEDQADFDATAKARNLGWGKGKGDAPLIAGDGDFHVVGTDQAWKVDGKATLRREAQTAQVQLQGEGDGNGLTLKTLSAAMPEGRLDAQGRLDWAPQTRWQAQALLSGFDPGYFLPEWRGAVRGKLENHGTLDSANKLTAEVKLQELGGQLRGRALRGHGQLHVDGEEYAGELDIGMGASQVQAKGRYGQRIELDAQLNPLQLADFLPDAQGVLQGQVQVKGTPRAFNVQAQLDGRQLRYADYQADSLSLSGHLPWQGDTGQLQLRASNLKAGIAVEQVAVNARGAVENLQLDVDARTELGRLQLAGSAVRRGGNWGGQLDSLQVDPTRGARWQLQAPLVYAQTGNGWRVDQGCLASNAGGRLCVDGQWPGQGLTLTGRELPLQMLATYLPETQDNSSWQIDGNLDVDAGLKPAGEQWAGQVALSSPRIEVRLGKRGSDPLMTWTALKLQAELDPRSIRAQLESGISNDGRLNAQLETGWDDFAPLSGKIDIDMRELAWLEVFAPDIVDPSGTVNGQILLSGTRGSPLMGGEALAQNVRAEVPAYGLVLNQGQFALRAQSDGNARIEGRINSGEGTLNINGTLGWQSQEVPITLHVSGENVLLSDTRDLRAVVNPDVTVKIEPKQPINVSGTVTLPSARMDLERLDAGVSRSDDVVVLDPANPERGGVTLLAMDLALVIGNDVELRGFGLEGKLGGQLRVRATPGKEMRGTGTLTVDGRYTAYGQKLLIEEGQLNWSNDPVSNPNIELRAKREIGDVTAGIEVTGRASAPQAQVWSKPSMDQSEALAYLTLGRSLSSVSATEGRQINAATAALSAGSTLLASQVATRIGFDDAGMIQSNTLGGSVFGVGKYLSPRVYVSYGVSLLGAGQVITLKYLLRKGFDISIESSTVENKASANWRKEK